MFWMRVSKQVHLHSCLYKTNKKKHRTLTAYNKLLELQPIWQLHILTNSLPFCLKTNRIMFSSLWPLALTFCPKKTPPSRFHWDEKSSVGSHCSLPPTGTKDGPSGQLLFSPQAPRQKEEELHRFFLQHMTQTQVLSCYCPTIGRENISPFEVGGSCCHTGLLRNMPSSNRDKNTTNESEQSAGSRRVSATFPGPSHIREPSSGTLTPTPLTTGLIQKPRHFNIPALISFNSASLKCHKGNVWDWKEASWIVPLHLIMSWRKTPFRLWCLSILLTLVNLCCSIFLWSWWRLRLFP